MPRQKGAARRKEREVLGAIKAQARRARVKYWSQYSRKITERRERSKARRACAYCDARGTIMAPTFSVCARCRGPRYCSRLCQRAHWIDGHKDVCVRVRG